ncbi:DEAD-box ATP-dependent RNA helicase 53-like [Olea europaea subsp. europaea]|nr:DEAD-box ATP-dependent RNA helicase 53-like [Olea europaea subsp. europaea]
MDALKQGVDVVVGTPGLVIDLIKRGSLSLLEVQFVALDEADQMFNVGFMDDVETIQGYMSQKHQTIMFLATMLNWIIKLIQKFFKNPVIVDLVGDFIQISLLAISSEMQEKPAIIGTLINEHAKGGKCIVFTKTKCNVDQLAYFRQRNFSSEALHGDISQKEMKRTLSGVRDGPFNMLVAIDDDQATKTFVEDNNPYDENFSIMSFDAKNVASSISISISLYSIWLEYTTGIVWNS